MQNDSLWQVVLGEIELSVSRGNFLTWFKNTELVKSDESTVIIGVPNIFIKQQLERKYNRLITEVLDKNGVKPQSIEYKISTMSIKPTYEDAVIFGGAEVQAQALSNDEQATRTPSGSSLAHSYRQGLNVILSITS